MPGQRCAVGRRLVIILLWRIRESSQSKCRTARNTSVLTIFEQVLLNYCVVLIVRAVSRTTSHHRHDGLSLSRKRITGCLNAGNYRSDVNSSRVKKVVCI